MTKKILDPVIHARLIEEIDDVARVAGIPRRYIETSAVDTLAANEIAWLKGIRHHAEKGIFGCCFQQREHHTEMMAMAGALTRNFVLAQVMTLNHLLELLRNGETIQATVLLIPSFHRAGAKGGVTAYQLTHLWSLLEDRMLSEKQTVIGVQSISQMKIDYGSHFADLVTNHYKVL